MSQFFGVASVLGKLEEYLYISDSTIPHLSRPTILLPLRNFHFIFITNKGLVADEISESVKLSVEGEWLYSCHILQVGDNIDQTFNCFPIHTLLFIVSAFHCFPFRSTDQIIAHIQNINIYSSGRQIPSFFRQSLK